MPWRCLRSNKKEHTPCNIQKGCDDLCSANGRNVFEIYLGSKNLRIVQVCCNHNITCDKVVFCFEEDDLSHSRMPMDYSRQQVSSGMYDWKLKILAVTAIYSKRKTLKHDTTKSLKFSIYYNHLQPLHSFGVFIC